MRCATQTATSYLLAGLLALCGLETVGLERTGAAAADADPGESGARGAVLHEPKDARGSSSDLPQRHAPIGLATTSDFEESTDTDKQRSGSDQNAAVTSASRVSPPQRPHAGDA